jgi:predicted Fe-Mo cluster-binding NifX family protein
MKICITSKGKSLESQVDPRFGRCAYFIVIDPDSMEFETMENSNSQAMGGAGIQSGQMISSKGVKAVLTGNVGPNAFQTLQASGIDIITGVSGSVEEVVRKYKAGEFKPIEDPTVGSHYGMKKNK